MLLKPAAVVLALFLGAAQSAFAASLPTQCIGGTCPTPTPVVEPTPGYEPTPVATSVPEPTCRELAIQCKAKSKELSHKSAELKNAGNRLKHLARKPKYFPEFATVLERAQVIANDEIPPLFEDAKAACAKAQLCLSDHSHTVDSTGGH